MNESESVCVYILEACVVHIYFEAVCTRRGRPVVGWKDRVKEGRIE